MKYKVTVAEAMVQLNQQQKHRFTTLLQHGSMKLEYYAPKGEDLQMPHTQDEIYCIISGYCTFNYNGELKECEPGDVLFVPAGVEHRFESFTIDFATWVIFYGKEGGEASALTSERQ